MPERLIKVAPAAERLRLEPADFAQRPRIDAKTLRLSSRAADESQNIARSDLE